MMKNYILLLLTLVLVQETFAQTANLSPDRYNTVYDEIENANGAGGKIFAGKTNQGALRRGLLHFDASSIPAGATITAVSLSMDMDKTRAGAESIAIHALSADWGAGSSDAPGNEGQGITATLNDATWACSFANGLGSCVSAWSTAGGDFGGTPLATSSVAAVGAYSWSSAALVAAVQSWVDVPANNFGIITIGNELSNRTAKRFNVSTINLSVTYSMPIVTTVDAGPSNDTICDGGNAAFAITATNAITYQWQEFTSAWADLSDAGVYSGTGTDNLMLTGAAFALNGNMYRCIATGASNSDTSSAATLVVRTVPNVNLSPGDTVICDGDSVLLTGSNGGSSQWYINGNMIVGATSNTYVADSSGNYNMVKTNMSGCADSASTGIEVVISLCSNINKIEASNTLAIFPNPASDKVTIQTENNLIFSVELFDIESRKVRELTTINKATADLNLEGLNAGIYLVRAIVDKQLVTKKIVIE